MGINKAFLKLHGCQGITKSRQQASGSLPAAYGGISSVGQRLQKTAQTGSGRKISCRSVGEIGAIAKSGSFGCLLAKYGTSEGAKKAAETKRMGNGPAEYVPQPRAAAQGEPAASPKQSVMQRVAEFASKKLDQFVNWSESQKQEAAAILSHPDHPGEYPVIEMGETKGDFYNRLQDWSQKVQEVRDKVRSQMQ